MKKVFIGMPVCNGEETIKRAIDSLIQQSYRDWILYISDNCSTDNTGQICEEFTKDDSRIHYFRQSQDIGAGSNFAFVLAKADCDHFMWASSDDVWHKDFVMSCIRQMQEKECDMAFSNIVNIDKFDRVIRNYPDFSRFATSCQLTDIITFLLDPEVLGKANLIYSLFKTELCLESWRVSPLVDHWGSDICFVLAALARNTLAIDRQVLFCKRIIRDFDCIESTITIEVENPFNHVFPLFDAVPYIAGLLKAVQGTPYYETTVNIMVTRLNMVLRKDILMTIDALNQT